MTNHTLTTRANGPYAAYGLVTLNCSCGWAAGMELEPRRAEYFGNFHLEMAALPPFPERKRTADWNWSGPRF